MRATRMLRIAAVVFSAPLLLLNLAASCSDSTTIGELVDALTTSTATDTSASSLLAKLDNASAELTATTTETTDTSTTTTSTSTDETSSSAAASDQGGPQLTDEQRAALEALQASLDAGEITQDEFCQQVRDLLGDPPCPWPIPPIELTDDQRTQAEAIFQQAHDQIVALHQAARDAVLATLTTDQQQKLTELEAASAPPADENAPAGNPCPPSDSSACAPPSRVPLPPCPTQDASGPQPPGDMAAAAEPPPGPPPGPPMGDGPQGPPALCLSDDTIAELALTTDQVTTITDAHDALQSGVAAAQDAAQAAFRALLTDTQLQALDQAPPPPPPPHGPRPPR